MQYSTYRQRVLAACRAARVSARGRLSFIRECWEQGVTVADAVSVVREA